MFTSFFVYFNKKSFLYNNYYISCFYNILSLNITLIYSTVLFVENTFIYFSIAF